MNLGLHNTCSQVDMLFTQHPNSSETGQYLGSCGLLSKPEFYCLRTTLLQSVTIIRLDIR